MSLQPCMHGTEFQGCAYSRQVEDRTFSSLLTPTGAVEQRTYSGRNCRCLEGPINATGQRQAATGIVAAHWGDPSIHMKVTKPLLRDIH